MHNIPDCRHFSCFVFLPPNHFANTCVSLKLACTDVTDIFLSIFAFVFISWCMNLLPHLFMFFDYSCVKILFFSQHHWCFMNVCVWMLSFEVRIIVLSVFWTLTLQNKPFYNKCIFFLYCFMVKVKMHEYLISIIIINGITWRNKAFSSFCHPEKINKRA